MANPFDPTAMAARTAQTQTNWRETSWDEVASYIGPNASKFQNAWERHRTVVLDKGHALLMSFCLPALLLSFVWFFYRKMWLVGILMFVLPTLVYFVTPFAAPILWVLSAFLAPSLYFHHAMANISKIRAAVPKGPERNAALAKAGNVAWPAAVISGALLFFSVIAAVMLALGWVPGVAP